ncbi:MAG: AAA family ATPase, partial [Bacteroidota bacterium]
MSRHPVAQVNRFLLHEAPPSLRTGYRDVISDPAPSSRHRQLCVLGERALAYLASLTVSLYRAGDAVTPSIESAFGRMQRCSLGHYIELLRLGSKASLPLAGALLDPETQLPAAMRFAAAMRGIEEAVELDARDLRRSIERNTSGSLKRVRMASFWETFVGYRNRAEGHSASHNWPVQHPEYFALMTPYLEAALTEVLTAPPIVRAFEEYAVAELEGIEYAQGRFVHAFAGEHGGIPFRLSIEQPESLQLPDADGDDPRGAPFVLAMGAPEGAVGAAGAQATGPYYDLLKDGAPAPKAVPQKSTPNAGEATDEDRRRDGPARPRLYGREAEFRAIDAVLDRCAAPGEAPPHGHVIFLAGESGVGKSSMAHEVSRRARSLGFEVVDVACEPFHQGMSLFP